MRPTLLVSALALVAGCSGSSHGSNLKPDLHCGSNADCGTDASCLANNCVTNGSLKAGQTCSQQDQCGKGLICHKFVCKPGCLDLYYLDDCADGTWCKPVPGASIQVSETQSIPVGSCAASECDPSSTTTCDDGSACVAISGTVGACLPYCEYGFNSDTYVDNCTDDPGVDDGCQPLGLTQVPVCLPKNDNDPPAVGSPGCDAIRAPCGAGAICVNVVCRQLCTTGQADPCGAGASCVRLGTRPDVFYCRAD